MNIKRIEKICREKRQIYVLTGDNGEQWIGTAEGMYLMGDLERITARQFFKIFELPKEEETLYELSDGEKGAIPEEYSDSDAELNISDMIIEVGGFSLIPFFCGGTAYWVKSDRLSPLSDEKNLSYSLRKNGDKCTIVIHKGIFPIAEIAPTNIFAEILYENLRRAFFGLRGEWKYDE